MALSQEIFTEYCMTSKITLSSILLIGLSLISYSSSEAQINFKFGGYFQTWLILNEYRERDPNDLNTWGFRIRRSRLNAQADIADRFNVNTWIEFSDPQRHLMDFYVSWKISPGFNLRFGQFRPPGQMYAASTTSSSNLLLYERPNSVLRLSNNMGYDSLRDIGILASGSSHQVSFGFYVGNGMGRFFQSGTHIESRDFGGGLYGGRIDVNPVNGLVLGGHFSVNKQNNVVVNGSQPFDIDRLSYSIRLAMNDLGISGFFTQFEFGGGSVNDNEEFDFSGYYLEAGYRINPSWSILARYDYYTDVPPSGVSLVEENVIFGVLYLWMYNNREIIRMGANYGIGNTDPGNFSRNIFLFWSQIRFMQ
jgi:hypothetical protein